MGEGGEGVTKEELAKELDGIEYPVEIDDRLSALAKESGLVIVYGASDDLMGFEGAIYDERGAYEGTTVLVDSWGLLPDRDCIEDDDVLENFFIRRKTAKPIRAIWNKDGYSFIYETEIPHVTFEVMEDGEKYCRGIVFSLKDIG